MFDRRPCITDEEVAWRITQERKVIEKMKLVDGYPVKMIAAWQSPSTFECHAMPIFTTDTWQDVCNRYFDLFPKESKEIADETAAQRSALDKGGFSADKTLMMVGSVPAGLRKFLDCWHPQGDFWKDRRLRKAFFNYFSKFKVYTKNESVITT